MRSLQGYCKLLQAQWSKPSSSIQFEIPGSESSQKSRGSAQPRSTWITARGWALDTAATDRTCRQRGPCHSAAEFIGFAISWQSSWQQQQKIAAVLPSQKITELINSENLTHVKIRYNTANSSFNTNFLYNSSFERYVFTTWTNRHSSKSPFSVRSHPWMSLTEFIRKRRPQRGKNSNTQLIFVSKWWYHMTVCSFFCNRHVL